MFAKCYGWKQNELQLPWHNITHSKNLSLRFLMYKISGVMVTKGFGKKNDFVLCPNPVNNPGFLFLTLPFVFLETNPQKRTPKNGLESVNRRRSKLQTYYNTAWANRLVQEVSEKCLMWLRS